MSKNQKYISFREVSKTYQDTVALNKISFDIFQGDVFGYIGPNGAGKTTTIKILVGLIDAYQGRYEIENHSPATICHELGYLPQGVSFQNWRTVDNVLKTFGKISALDGAFIENQIEKITELLELKEVRYKSIAKLSGGMIQKLGLAQALLNKPRLLVLDEPFSGLDPTSRYELKKIIKELSQQGTTIFFSSHILSDVQEITNRIAIIHKGCILKIGDTEKLTADFYPSTIFQVTFFDDFDDSDLLDSFSNLDHVERKTAKQIVLHIHKDSDPKSFTREFIKKLVDSNHNIASFGRITPNLDEIYLKYVRDHL